MEMSEIMSEVNVECLINRILIKLNIHAIVSVFERISEPTKSRLSAIAKEVKRGAYYEH